MCDLCESDLSPLQLYSPPSDTESALKLNSAVVVVLYGLRVSAAVVVLYGLRVSAAVVVVLYGLRVSAAVVVGY